LYTTEIVRTSNASTALDSPIKFASKMTPIPLFEGRENCTYTVRVPRFHLAASWDHPTKNNAAPALEEICKRRQLWGTDVYTDDSDVVAAAVHSGWLRGDFGPALNRDLQALDTHGSDDDEHQQQPQQPPRTAHEALASAPAPATTLTSRPAKPVQARPDRDLHITLLLLPALQAYAGTARHHLRSRAWERPHDGMSFCILRIDFVDEAGGNRVVERGGRGRKERMLREEGRRREVAAAGLLMMGTAAGAIVRVGA
ncbi:hypothetical protein LTR53_018000, partial [Teratosphaeriaceae sp. CCFEE 6253]